MRFAINAPDIATAADCLGRASGFPFERRDSCYYGEYCLIRLPGGGSVRVLENVDPMYRADLDPPEFRFFEAGFPPEQVLIEIGTLDMAQLADWKRIIREMFPAAVPTGRAQHSSLGPADISVDELQPPLRE